MSAAADRIEKAKRAYHDAVKAVTDARLAHSVALDRVVDARRDLEYAIELAKREQSGATASAPLSAGARR